MANLLDIRTWTLGADSCSGFASIGSAGENMRIIDKDPWNQDNIVWEARPSGNYEADGGWNGLTYPIDNTKTYRFSVWARRTVIGDGYFYLGLYSYTAGDAANVGVYYRDDVNTNQTNPYFHSGILYNTFIANQWYLFVGHVWPVNSGTGAMHTDSGRYTITSGKVANASRDFVWRSDGVRALHRSYGYYSYNTATRQQFIYPRIDLCDGTEPTVTQLLRGHKYMTSLRTSSGTFNIKTQRL